MFAAPLAATVLAAFFAWQTGRAFARSRSASLAIWSFSLVQFAIASALLTWGVTFGWSSALYRVFYLFGAILNIGWLGLGTVLLMARGRTLRLIATRIVIAASVYAVVSTATAHMLPGAGQEMRKAAIPSAMAVMPLSVRLVSRVFSIGGSLVVIGGLVWSIVKQRRHVFGLALIACGVVIVGIAGELARADLVAGFSVALALGVGVMFAGFTRTGPRSSP